MPITMYHCRLSPPSRAVLAVATILGVDVTIKEIDLFTRDHLKEEYLKINPQHTVPIIIDDGFIVNDSHVIAAYLVSKYGKDDSLYPKDLKKRTLVDQRLYFNATTLFARLKATTMPVLFFGKRSVDPDRKADIYEALGNLEKFVEATGWVAGDHVTIADICCSATTTTAEAVGVDLGTYPKVRDWLKRCYSTFPCMEEINREGQKIIGDGVKSLLPPDSYAR